MSLVKFTRHQPRITFPGIAGIPAFEDVENRMRRFLENGDIGAFEGGLMAQTVGWIPPMEITETVDELKLTAELPGMDQKNVDVSVDDGVLNIRGEKAEERKEGEEGTKYYLSERNYGSFQRAFTLPRTVDAAKIKAEFVKGVLTVHMPKTTEAKVKGRKIEIGAGA